MRHTNISYKNANYALEQFLFTGIDNSNIRLAKQYVSILRHLDAVNDFVYDEVQERLTRDGISAKNLLDELLKIMDEKKDDKDYIAQAKQFVFANMALIDFLSAYGDNPIINAMNAKDFKKELREKNRITRFRRDLAHLWHRAALVVDIYSSALSADQKSDLIALKRGLYFICKMLSDITSESMGNEGDMSAILPRLLGYYGETPEDEASKKAIELSPESKEKRQKILTDILEATDEDKLKKSFQKFITDSEFDEYLF